MNEEVKAKFDAWLEEQSEETKTLVAERFSALEATVKATRTERDNLNLELKKLAKNVEVDSEAGKQLSELREKLQLAERKSNFIEQATKQGAKRPGVAFALANSENLFSEDGEPDWERIKETIPELFTVASTNTDAGSGTTTKIPDSAGVNTIKTYLDKKNQKG